MPTFSDTSEICTACTEDLLLADAVDTGAGCSQEGRLEDGVVRLQTVDNEVIVMKRATMILHAPKILKPYQSCKGGAVLNVIGESKQWKRILELCEGEIDDATKVNIDETLAVMRLAIEYDMSGIQHKLVLLAVFDIARETSVQSKAELL